MAHLDLYLDKCPAFGWSAAPMFNTTVVLLRNKRARRNAEWSQPQWHFTVVFNNTMAAAYLQIIDTMLLCRGRLHAIRARNWAFYKASAWKFGTGDGTTDRFQLGRLIEGDGESFLQEIHALSLDESAPTPAVYVNGVQVGATFNDRTGEVLFDNPPANGAVLTWSGWFDFWVRFASDDLPASIDNKSQGEFVLNYQAELVETEPPDEEIVT